MRCKQTSPTLLREYTLMLVSLRENLRFVPLLPAAFRLFDRMMLLLRGRVVYFGARGEEATNYFKAVPLPEGQMMTSLGEGSNEAEWIVDITTQADRQERYILLPACCVTYS